MWHPNSWQSKRQAQSVDYADQAHLQSVLTRLADQPALITLESILELQNKLADIQAGEEGFFLQVGDCAERFHECHAAGLQEKVAIMERLCLALEKDLSTSVLCIGRLGGQFAKPRTHAFEEQDGIRLPSYRGDMINRPEFEADYREPDPDLMCQAYYHAQHVVQSVARMASRPIYFSHEALHLLYEQALTHRLADNWYLMSTQFPWLGVRTSQLGGAHVEFLRGIAGPIAVKVGPNVTRAWLEQIISILNPDNIPGRLTLIHRFGQDKIKALLPDVIKVVQASGCPVVWCCDPMHGNSRLTSAGIKTRLLKEIREELSLAVDIHMENNSRLHGIHLEMAPGPITECLDEREVINEDDLFINYQSQIDPRLSGEQAVALLTWFSQKLLNPA